MALATSSRKKYELTRAIEKHLRAPIEYARRRSESYGWEVVGVNGKRCTISEADMFEIVGIQIYSNTERIEFAHRPRMASYERGDSLSSIWNSHFAEAYDAQKQMTALRNQMLDTEFMTPWMGIDTGTIERREGQGRKKEAKPKAVKSNDSMRKVFWGRYSQTGKLPWAAK